MGLLVSIPVQRLSLAFRLWSLVSVVMHQPSLDHQRVPVSESRQTAKDRLRRTLTQIPAWAWLMLTAVLHILVGVLLSVFSPPLWVWPVAIAGVLLQVLVLAGPQAMSSFRGKQAILGRLVTCLGVALAVVAMAVAVGYGGTANIDDIRWATTGLTVFFVNLGVLALTALCSVLIAHVGDQLLVTASRASCSAFILSVCLFGLLCGAGLGIAIAR